ncbi:unnamed protein product [Caenorhabditis brenneri]
MTSKRTAQTVEVSRVKPSFAVVQISSSACIELRRGSIKSSPKIEENKVKISEVMKWKEMNKRDPTLRTWKHCIFEDKQISAEELRIILDTASPDRSFASLAEEGPKELRHEKALKFENNIHRDARWIKTEDLYKLNNCGTVTLGKNNFTQSDIKAFISYWVNSDIDMFWRSLSGFLTLTAWAPDEFTYTRGELDTMIKNKHGVIDLLIEKKQLELEEESANSENKRRIRSRLTQLDDEIRDYGVFYDNGRATLRVPTQ